MLGTIDIGGHKNIFNASKPTIKDAVFVTEDNKNLYNS